MSSGLFKHMKEPDPHCTRYDQKMGLSAPLPRRLCSPPRQWLPSLGFGSAEGYRHQNISPCISTLTSVTCAQSKDHNPSGGSANSDGLWQMLLRLQGAGSNGSPWCGLMEWPVPGHLVFRLFCPSLPLFISLSWCLLVSRAVFCCLLVSPAVSWGLLLTSAVFCGLLLS